MQTFIIPHDLPYVSEINTGDKELLQQVIQMNRPQSKRYEDSWGYIIQATRYGGFKWFDPRTGSLIFFGRKSEKDPTLVVPNFFTTPKKLSDIVREIENELNVSQTILKNINISDKNKLIAYGFRPYNKNEKWSDETRFDDQTYPQLIVDLGKIMEARGPWYQKLRTSIHKTPYFKIIKYNSQTRKEVLKIFTLKDKKFETITNKIKKIYFVSHAMYPSAAIEKYIITDNKDNVTGFTATSDITSKTTALVACLFKPGNKDVNLWGVYQTLAIKYWQGFQLANLGGCEFEATYKYKTEKFRPIEEIKKTHLVFS